MVVEASGSPAAASQSIKMARSWGRVCCLGISKDAIVSLPWNEAAYKNLEIVFSMSSNVTAWEPAISVMSREQHRLNRLITRRTVIDNWEEVFRDLEMENEVKVMFVPEPS